MPQVPDPSSDYTARMAALAGLRWQVLCRIASYLPECDLPALGRELEPGAWDSVIVAARSLHDECVRLTESAKAETSVITDGDVSRLIQLILDGERGESPFKSVTLEYTRAGALSRATVKCETWPMQGDDDA